MTTTLKPRTRNTVHIGHDAFGRYFARVELATPSPYGALNFANLRSVARRAIKRELIAVESASPEWRCRVERRHMTWQGFGFDATVTAVTFGEVAL